MVPEGFKWEPEETITSIPFGSGEDIHIVYFPVFLNSSPHGVRVFLPQRTHLTIS